MAEATERLERLEDGTYETTSLDYALGAIMLAGAALLGWMSRESFVFDLSSPDFNPLLFFVVFLIGGGLFYLGRAAHKTRRSSRWGVSTLGIASGDPRMGKKFSATVTCEGVEATQRDYEATMQLVETFHFHRRGSHDRRSRENVRWEQRVVVSGSQYRLRDGVPVTFQLPSKKDLQRQRDPAASVKGVIAVPAFKAGVLAHNVLPDAVRWVVAIEATSGGRKYSAAWGIPVRERFPLQSDP